MKSFLFLILTFPLFSCTKNNSDRDVQEGRYETMYPVSIDSIPLHDTWVIMNDMISIYRGDQEIYSSVITWEGNKIDLFPTGANPYYNESFSHATITTVSWGFWLYPESGKTFCLQRE